MNYYGKQMYQYLVPEGSKGADSSEPNVLLNPEILRVILSKNVAIARTKLYLSLVKMHSFVAEHFQN